MTPATIVRLVLILVIIDPFSRFEVILVVSASGDDVTVSSDVPGLPPEAADDIRNIVPAVIGGRAGKLCEWIIASLPS